MDDHTDPKKAIQSWKRAGGSSLALANDNPRLKELTQAATRLFSQFRKTDASDPDTFLVAAMAVLKEYPPDVVLQATHPFHGLPSIHKWLPSISEIREFCDREKARKESAGKLSAAVEQTLARRQEKSETTPEERAAHVARLRAEGKLSFEADPKPGRGSWFQQLSKKEAAANLEKIKAEFSIVAPSAGRTDENPMEELSDT